MASMNLRDSNHSPFQIPGCFGTFRLFIFYRILKKFQVLQKIILENAQSKDLWSTARIFWITKRAWLKWWSYQNFFQQNFPFITWKYFDLHQYLSLSHYLSLREKCPYLVFFWSVFSRIRTKYGDILFRIFLGTISVIKTESFVSISFRCKLEDSMRRFTVWRRCTVLN